jgi:Protein prenyltransferase alpha subunit repeat
VPYRTELEFLEPLSLKHLKNYQIWQHRQTIAAALTSPPDDVLSYEHEAAFMAQMLERDAKNYHVWVYRHWLVEALDLFGDTRELAAVDALLDEDVRNNSAWSHRWLLVFGVPAGREPDEADASHGAPGWPSEHGSDDEDEWVDDDDGGDEPRDAAREGGNPAAATAAESASAEDAPPPRPRAGSPPPKPAATAARSALADRAAVAREARYAMARVRAAPQNESPWNYLRALHTIPPPSARLPAGELRKFAEEFADLRAPEGAHPVGFEERVPLRGRAWYGGEDLGPKPTAAAAAAAAGTAGATVTLPVRGGRGDAAPGEAGAGGSEGARAEQSPPAPVRSSHALDVLASLLAEDEPEMAARALDLLATRYDPVRANYWAWRKAALPARGK